MPYLLISVSLSHYRGRSLSGYNEKIYISVR